MQLPGANEDTLAELAGVVRVLAGGLPGIERVVAATDAELAARGARALLGEGFEEFYYAHDATGLVCRQLAAAYPGAKTICTGDSFGMVYPADFVSAYHARPAAGPWLDRLRDWMRARGTPRPIAPDVAALVLPVDPSGRGLHGTRLVVCDKGRFLEVIRACHERADGLRAHSRELLRRSAGRPRFLLITSNYSEAGHVLAGREIEMYREIVRGLCPPGAALLVKPHPLERAGKAAELAAALGADYLVLGFDEAFSRYPVELCLELLRECRVIAMSYSVLSLKYAHDIDVLQPMDEPFIERWFEPHIRAWTRDALRLYMEPLARLKDWDGKGVLWAAP